MRPRKRYKVGYNEQIKDNAKSAYLIKEALNKGTLKPPSDAMVDPSGNPYVFALPAAIVGEEYTRDEQGRITFSSPLQRSNYFYNRNLGEEGISQAREMEASVREGTTNAVQGALQAYAAFSEPLSYLQKALVTAPLAQAMGKLDEVNLNPVAMLSGEDPGISSPSEALGIENPIGAFAVDALTDPLNFAGAGLLSAIRKQRMKGTDIPFDLPEGVGGGGPARNLPSGDGGTPKKKPNRYVPAPLGDNAFVPKSLMDQGILAKQARPDGTLPASVFENTMNSDNLSSGDKTYIRKAIELIPGSVRENGDIDINALRSAVNTFFKPVVKTTSAFADYGASSVNLKQNYREIPDDVVLSIDDSAQKAAKEIEPNSGTDVRLGDYFGDARSFLIELEHQAHNKSMVRPTEGLTPISNFLPVDLDFEKISNFFKESEKNFFSDELKSIDGENLPDAYQTSYGPLVLRNDDGTYKPNVSEQNLESNTFWPEEEVLPQLNRSPIGKVGISQDVRKDFLRNLAGLSEASQKISKSFSVKSKNTGSELSYLLGDLEGVLNSIDESVRPVLERFRSQMPDLDKFVLYAGDRDDYGDLVRITPSEITLSNFASNDGNMLFDFSNYRSSSFSQNPAYNLLDQVDVSDKIKNAKDAEERDNITLSFYNLSHISKDLDKRSVTRLFDIIDSVKTIESSFSTLDKLLNGYDVLRGEETFRIRGLKELQSIIKDSDDPVLKEMFDALLDEIEPIPLGSRNLLSVDGKENFVKVKPNTSKLNEFVKLVRYSESLTTDQLGRRLSITPAISRVFQGTRIDHKNKFYAEAFERDMSVSSADIYSDYVKEDDLLSMQLRDALKDLSRLVDAYVGVASSISDIVDSVNRITILSRNNMMVDRTWRNPEEVFKRVNLYKRASKEYAKNKKVKQTNRGVLSELVKRGKDPSRINVGNTTFLFSASPFAKDAGFRGPGNLIETDEETGIKTVSDTKKEFTHFRDESHVWGHARVYVDPDNPTEMIILEIQSDLFQIGKDRPNINQYRRKKGDFNEIEAPFLKQLKSGLSGYERAQIYSTIQQAVNSGQESILLPTKETVTFIEGYTTEDNWQYYDDPSDRIEAAKSPIYMRNPMPEPGEKPEDYSIGIEKIRDGYENLARAISKELGVPLEKVKRKGYEYYKFDIPEKFVKREGEMPVFAKGGKFTIKKITPKKFLRAMKKK